MAWDIGIQKPIKKFNSKTVNEELMKLEGSLDEYKAKVTLTEFLKANISFASYLLLGVELFPFQAMMVKTMMINDYSMCVLSRGGSKCSEENEMCFTNNGMKKLKDVEVGEYIQSFKGYNLVREKTVNPIQKTYTAVTSAGYSSGGLDYHRTYVFNPETLEFEWRFAKDLNAGDIIPIRKGFNFWPEEKEIRGEIFGSQRFNFDPYQRSLQDWYYFFGLLIGDGHYTGVKNQKNGVGLTTKDIEIATWAQNFVTDVMLLPRSEPKLDDKGLFLIKLIRGDFIDWMRNLGFDPDKIAHEKTIPALLLNNSKGNITTLLSGLFDTDGYCSISKTKKNTTRTRVGFSSSSEELINQVQILLLNLGIETSKIVAFKGGKSSFGKLGEYECRKAWSLVINNSSACRIFDSEIGFKLPRKSDKLKQAFTEQIHGDFGYNKKIPCQKYLESKYSGYFGKGVKLATGSKSISLQKLQKIYDSGKLDDGDKNKVYELLNTDIYYDTVKEVIEGEHVTIDLNVENEHCYFSNGFTNHNTFSCAVYVMLELLLNQGCNIGVISASFRQAKMIFLKIEEILNSGKCPLVFKEFKLTKGTDQWVLEVGRSRATALPLAGGERLRGFRFTRIVIDEFLLMPEKIFNEVILPFLGVVTNPQERDKLKKLEDILIKEGKMTEEQRHKWDNNKLILLSSPSFKFEYMYKLYQTYEGIILGAAGREGVEGSENIKGSTAIIQLAYDMLPEALYDANLLNQAKNSMSEIQFKREFGAQFIDESDGYFKLSKMEACTPAMGDFPSVEVAGRKEDEYILSFDPSWSGESASDNFAMHVIRIDYENQKGHIVHSYGLAGAELKSHIQYFLYLLQNFNITGIIGDYNGGVSFIDACNESEQFKNAKIKIQVIDIAFDDPQEYLNDLRDFKNQYNRNEYKICYLRRPLSSWIRVANESLQGAFDHKRIIFASAPDESVFEEQKKLKIPIEELKYTTKEGEGFFDKKSAESKKIDFIDNLKIMVEQTKAECANIEVRTSPQGNQVFDLPESLKRMKGANRPRKDNYSALVLGNWFLKIMLDLKTAPKTNTETFKPFII